MPALRAICGIDKGGRKRRAATLPAVTPNFSFVILLAVEE